MNLLVLRDLYTELVGLQSQPIYGFWGDNVERCMKTMLEQASRYHIFTSHSLYREYSIQRNKIGLSVLLK